MTKDEALKSRRWLLWGIITVLAASLVGAGAAYFLSPYLTQREEERTLQTLQAQRGELKAASTHLVPFTGPSVAHSNSSQKALVTSPGEQVPLPRFVFRNEHAPAAKTIDVYLDFSSQASRDFIAFNSGSLTSLVEQGRATLAIHPVPAKEPLSIYGPEAVAEVLASSPEEAWPYFLAVMKEAPALRSLKQKELVAALAAQAQKQGAQEVDEDSLLNGTFSSWLVTGAHDLRLAGHGYPPLLFVDGKMVDPTAVSYNSTSDVAKAISKNL